MIKIPKDFNVNLLEPIVKAYEEDFIWSPNIIGASSLPYGLRKNVLKKTRGKREKTNNKMFAGKIIHKALQQPKVLEFITKRINKGLGLTEKEVGGKRYVKLSNGRYIEFEVQAEKADFIEIYPGNYLRLHTDIYSTLYCIEIKTTSMPLKMWGDLAPYFLMQANIYTGFNRHDIGFILRIDLGCAKGGQKHGGFLQSASKYWKYIWNNYFMLYPYDFDPKLFQYTIKRAKKYFNYLDLASEPWQIPCPKFEFECNGCSVRDACPNPIDRVKMEKFDTCEACGERIRMKTTALIRNDRMYHYTDEKGRMYDKCIQACFDAYEVEFT